MAARAVPVLLKSPGVESGGQSAGNDGAKMRLKWSADDWDTRRKYVSKCTCQINHSYIKSQGNKRCPLHNNTCTKGTQMHIYTLLQNCRLRVVSLVFVASNRVMALTVDANYSQTPANNRPLKLSGVECTGDETTMRNCAHRPWGDLTCAWGGRAVVDCEAGI